MSLKECVLSFREKGNVFLDEFNPRVGRYVHIDVVIGTFGEDMLSVLVQIIINDHT